MVRSSGFILKVVYSPSSRECWDVLGTASRFSRCTVDRASMSTKVEVYYLHYWPSQTQYEPLVLCWPMSVMQAAVSPFHTLDGGWWNVCRVTALQQSLTPAGIWYKVLVASVTGFSLHQAISSLFQYFPIVILVRLATWSSCDTKVRGGN